MTRWNYTHQGTLLLPSVPSPRSHLRPSGLRQSRVHRNPSPWLPASRRRNGPASTGRATAGRERLSANEDTANLRGISRQTATAVTGERASRTRQIHIESAPAVPVPAPVADGSAGAGPVADGSAGAGPAASGGSTTSDGPAVRNGTVTGNDPITDRPQATARPQGTDQPQGTARQQGKARPQVMALSQWTARPQLWT